MIWYPVDWSHTSDFTDRCVCVHKAGNVVSLSLGFRNAYALHSIKCTYYIGYYISLGASASQWTQRGTAYTKECKK